MPPPGTSSSRDQTQSPATLALSQAMLPPEESLSQHQTQPPPTPARGHFMPLPGGSFSQHLTQPPPTLARTHFAFNVPPSALGSSQQQTQPPPTPARGQSAFTMPPLAGTSSQQQIPQAADTKRSEEQPTVPPPTGTLMPKAISKPAISAATELTLEEVRRIRTKPQQREDLFQNGDEMRKRFASLSKSDGRGVQDDEGGQAQCCTPQFQRKILNATGEVFSCYFLPPDKFGPKDKHNLMVMTFAVLKEIKRLRARSNLWVNLNHHEVFCNSTDFMYKKLVQLMTAYKEGKVSPPPQLLTQGTWSDYMANPQSRNATAPYAQTLPPGAKAIRDRWVADYERIMEQQSRDKSADSEETRARKETARKNFYDLLPDFNEGYEKTSLQGAKVLATKSTDDAKQKGTVRGGYVPLYHLNQLANKYNPGREGEEFGSEEGEVASTFDVIAFPKAAVRGDDDLGGFKGRKQ